MIDLSHESDPELERMATEPGYRDATPEARAEAQRELSRRYEARRAELSRRYEAQRTAALWTRDARP